MLHMNVEFRTHTAAAASIVLFPDQVFSETKKKKKNAFILFDNDES